MEYAQTHKLRLDRDISNKARREAEKDRAKLLEEQGDDANAASEKIVEIHFTGGKPVRTGDQFGVGRVR